MFTQKKIFLAVFILVIVGLNIGVNVWRKSNLAQLELHEFPSQAYDITSMQFDEEGNIRFLDAILDKLVVTDKRGALIKKYTEDDIGIKPKTFFFGPRGRVFVAGSKEDLSSGTRKLFGGVSVFDGADWELIISKEDNNRTMAGSATFSPIAIDPKGWIWMATHAEDGLWVFEDTDKWINYTAENSGLPDDDVRAIAFDKGWCQNSSDE